MEAQTIICANCQTPNPAKNLYCQSCGKPLIQAAPRPPVPPVYQASPEPAQPQSAGRGMPPPPVPIPYPNQSQTPPSGEGQVVSPASPALQPEPTPPPVSPQPAQPAYVPPPPPPAPTLEQLGVRSDSWADLITGASDKTGELLEAFLAEIKARSIPQASLESIDILDAGLPKNYQVVRNPFGAVAVRISSYGMDLSIGWSLYTRRILNQRMLAILLGIAFAVSFLTSLNAAYNFGFFITGWLFGTFRWLLDTAILALIAGYVWKGNFWHFFLVNRGESAREETVALTMAVNAALLAAVEKVGLDPAGLRVKTF